MSQIQFVTFTGADDSVDPAKLIELSKKYEEKIEFGILFSVSKEGTDRYPSASWINKLADMVTGHNIKLSAHLCGSYVDTMAVVKSSSEYGKHLWLDTFQDASTVFQRVQINSGHQPPVDFSETEYLRSLKRIKEKAIIIQTDGIKSAHHTLLDIHGLMVSSLVDSSGGRGSESIFIPPGYESEWGFAGGINPDNVQDKIANIMDVYSGSFWIDMESGVRTENKFDLVKVESVMKIICSQ